MTRPRFTSDRLLFGGDYNPEQWSADVWDEDVRLMREAGVTFVTVGIFAWAHVEPQPGTFEFAWFDDVLDRLASAGIAASVATMTGSPPPWMAHRHPETLPVLEDGTVLHPGARQHYCPSSPVYREYAVRLVERLADRYRDHPALALWHVNNEYGCHVDLSYSLAAEDGFRTWLRERYETLEALNDAWSTAFWSQRYGAWEEIGPPRTAPTFINPAQRLDFRRYSSDALLACYRAEAEVLRRVTPDVPVTTNFLNLWKSVDYHSWAADLDVVALDSYPDPMDPEAALFGALSADLTRSLGGGRPWLLMESAPSALNWRERNAAKPAGLNRLWSWQNVARGADAVMYFQWRQSRGGAERFHSAMVPHAGTDTRVHREVKALGHELAGVPELAGSTVPADVALLMSWPSWWALEGDGHPTSDLLLRERLMELYRPLWHAGITCDVVAPDADLSGYKLVLAPSLYLLTAREAANVTDFVSAGGHALVTFFSGIVDACDRVHLGGYPGPWRELLGLWVEEFWPLPRDRDETVALGQARHAARTWTEIVHPTGAEVVATFASGDLAGGPALLRTTFGSGVAWYLATSLDEAGTQSVVLTAARAAGATPVLEAKPAGVEVVRRRGQDGEYLFCLNHAGGDVTVPLPQGSEVLVGSPRLGPLEVLVARLAASHAA